MRASELNDAARGVLFRIGIQLGPSARPVPVSLDDETSGSVADCPFGSNLFRIRKEDDHLQCCPLLLREALLTKESLLSLASLLSLLSLHKWLAPPLWLQICFPPLPSWPNLEG